MTVIYEYPVSSKECPLDSESDFKTTVFIPGYHVPHLNAQAHGIVMMHLTVIMHLQLVSNLPV